MIRALLVGSEPAAALGYEYVPSPPYDAVVIGSLTIGQLLRFREERVLAALAEGKSVFLYTPGLPESRSRALAAALACAQRELKSWGIRFIDGRQRQLVTAEEAHRLRRTGQLPAPGAVLTPLAKEILGGME